MTRGGTAIYSKGDKISVIKGDMNGIKGTIEAIEDTQITFKAIGAFE
jgi:ribosomal protein L24